YSSSRNLSGARTIRTFFDDGMAHLPSPSSGRSADAITTARAGRSRAARGAVASREPAPDRYGWPAARVADREGARMTLLYRIVIEDEVHQVRIEAPRGEPGEDRTPLERLALTAAWLEHRGLLPRGVTNSFD